MPARLSSSRLRSSRQERQQVIAIFRTANLNAVEPRQDAQSRNSASADTRMWLSFAAPLPASPEAPSDRLKIDVVLEQHAGQPAKIGEVLTRAPCIPAALHRSRADRSRDGSAIRDRHWRTRGPQTEESSRTPFGWPSIRARYSTDAAFSSSSSNDAALIRGPAESPGADEQRRPVRARSGT